MQDSLSRPEAVLGKLLDYSLPSVGQSEINSFPVSPPLFSVLFGIVTSVRTWSVGASGAWPFQFRPQAIRGQFNSKVI
jgi:hypothetical protein